MADYISREAAIKEFCDDCMDREWCKSNGESCSRIKNINAVLAADVRPVVKSRWVEIDDYVLCANCGVAEHSPNRNYCHCCGADMRPEPPEEGGGEDENR